jgi:hypothetical protein
MVRAPLLRAKVTNMPKEVHYFLFSADEVKQALLDYYTLGNPASRIAYADGLQLFDTEQIGVGAKLILPSTVSARPSELTFTPADVLEAIIQYCRSRRIPLARRAEKSIHAIDDQIALASIANVSLRKRKGDGSKPSPQVTDPVSVPKPLLFGQKSASERRKQTTNLSAKAGPFFGRALAHKRVS